MLDAAREAIRFAEGKRREDLDTDRVLMLALVKCIENIGEAAAKVTERGRRDHPEIPWTAIIGMRNRLIHGYFSVDANRVWDTITADLTPLAAALENILEER